MCSSSCRMAHFFVRVKRDNSTNGVPLYYTRGVLLLPPVKEKKGHYWFEIESSFIHFFFLIAPFFPFIFSLLVHLLLLRVPMHILYCDYPMIFLIERECVCAMAHTHNVSPRQKTIHHRSRRLKRPQPPKNSSLFFRPFHAPLLYNVIRIPFLSTETGRISCRDREFVSFFLHSSTIF